MSAPDRSGDQAELVKRIRLDGSAAKLLAEHAPDKKGRCGPCRSIGCSLYNAALLASKKQPTGGPTT